MTGRVRRLIDWGTGVYDFLMRTFPGRLALRFSFDDGPNWSVVLAWNYLTAAFPITLLLTATAGFVLGRLGISPEQITTFAIRLFPGDPQTQATVAEAVNGVQQASGTIAVIALLGFLWSAMNLFGAMEAAFDRALGCPRRGIVPQWLMALLMMALFTVLFVVAVLAAAVLPALGEAAYLPDWVTSIADSGAARFAVGVATASVLFACLYLLVPNARIGLRDTWPGIAFGGVTFQLLGLLFPIYVALNRGLNRYGATFAFVLVLVAFFYYLGLITVFGVELNGTWIQHRREERARRAATAPSPPRGPLRRAFLAVVAGAVGVVAAVRR